MALVSSTALGPIILAPYAGKDSRWLTLEVCREFARSKCSRNDEECKYAHPPSHVEIQNGRVTCCFDSIKGKCQRKDPPCKYLHPPQHLKEILLQNGRQNLILKNLQMQATTIHPPAVVPLPSVYPVAPAPPSIPQPSVLPSTHPYSSVILPSGQYLTLMQPPATTSRQFLMPTGPVGYTYYNTPSIGSFPAIVPAYDNGNNCALPASTGGTNHLAPAAVASTVSPAAAAANGIIQHQHLVDSSAPTLVRQQERHLVEVMTALGRNRPHESTAAAAASDDLVLGVGALPGMMPVLKRPALVDPKSGLPVYRQYTSITHPQAAAAAALHLQQTQFIPINIAGTTPVIPRIN